MKQASNKSPSWMLQRSRRRHSLPWYVWRHASEAGRIRTTCRFDNQLRTCQRRFHGNRLRHDNRLARSVEGGGEAFGRRNESISRFPPLSRQRHVIVVTWSRGHVTAQLVYGGNTGLRFGRALTFTAAFQHQLPYYYCEFHPFVVHRKTH